jgi:taurine dioxygenase
MHIEEAAPGIGAVVTGVDVKHLNAEEWDTLYRLWLDRNVLVVRGQDLGIDAFLDYSRRFGRLKPHRVKRTRHPDYPELTVMGVNAKTAAGKVDNLIYNRGDDWHTDAPWDTEICKATQLYALEIPSYGGDTLFANMYTAYDKLPANLKKRIEGLQGEFVYGGRERRGVELLDPIDRTAPPAVHPVARRHAETGRTSLYVNPFHMLGFVGMPPDESTALMEELFTHMVAPDAQYRHKWQAGDLIIWDNRASLHAATGGYPPDEKRIHWRVTVME